MINDVFYRSWRAFLPLTSLQSNYASVVVWFLLGNSPASEFRHRGIIQNYPEEIVEHSEHGESLKSKKLRLCQKVPIVPQDIYIRSFLTNYNFPTGKQKLRDITMMSACLCVSQLHFWINWPIFMKCGMEVTHPEVITTSYVSLHITLDYKIRQAIE